MKRRIFLLLVTIVLLTGCVGGGVGVKKLNVRWKIVPMDEVTSMAVDGEEGVNTLEKRYARMPTEMDRSVIEIEADLSGKTSGEFEFELATNNPYEKVRNNAVRLEPTQAEKGSVLVKAEGEEAVVPYEIFPANIISVWGNPYRETAFSFEQDKHVMANEGDVRFTNPREDEEPYHLKANVAIAPIESRDDFWEDFIKINDLQEYEYKEKIFKPDLMNLYLIKTKNGGYAVMRFTASAGYKWNFMYKYSETGIFE